MSALSHASASGPLDVVQALLDKGAEVNARDDEGRTALTIASAYGRSEVVQTLLAKGAVGRRWFNFSPWLASPPIIFVIFGLSLPLAWGIWSALRVRQRVARLGIYGVLVVGAFGLCTLLPSNPLSFLLFFVQM